MSLALARHSGTHEIPPLQMEIERSRCTLPEASESAGQMCFCCDIFIVKHSWVELVSNKLEVLTMYNLQQPAVPI